MANEKEQQQGSPAIDKFMWVVTLVLAIVSHIQSNPFPKNEPKK